MWKDSFSWPASRAAALALIPGSICNGLHEIGPPFPCYLRSSGYGGNARRYCPNEGLRTKVALADFTGVLTLQRALHYQSEWQYIYATLIG